MEFSNDVLRAFAIIALASIFVATADASDIREVAKLEGWSVVHDPAGDGSCYATGKHGKGTTVTLGIVAPAATWFAVVSNAALDPIKVGALDEIRYVFGTKYVWTEKTIGTPDGLRSEEIGDEFVDDFARASSLKLVYRGKHIDTLKLVGARDVIAAINQCYVTYTSKAAPYAPPESTEARQSNND